LPIDFTKSGNEGDLEMFRKTLNADETLDLNSIYANNQVSEYLSNFSSGERMLLLYPNPANDIVSVEIPDDVSYNSRICIHDIMGKLLLSRNINSSIMEIDVNAFPRGMYKVVITGLNIYTATLVVTR
jgi:hypothetical protein